jgi:hypothetical protein
MLLGFAVVVLGLGCGSGKNAPVSGRVTLNDKPLPGAIVSFQPIAREGEGIDAGGVGSTGKTDANGEFTLTSATGKPGACVGEHRVVISVLTTKEGDDTRRRGGPPQVETVPSRYNSQTELKFEVPSGGTTKADFNLKSP